MRSTNEIFYYLERKMGIELSVVEKEIHTRAIEVILGKLVDGENVAIPIRVSSVKDNVLGKISRTGYALVTDMHRIIYSTQNDPYLLMRDAQITKLMENVVSAKIQIGDLVLEIPTKFVDVVIKEIGAYFDDWEDLASDDSWEMIYEANQRAEREARKAELREVEEREKKRQEEQREYEKKRTELEKEYEMLFAIQKAERIRRKVEYKVLSQDDAWFSAHVNTNKLEYVLNRYAADGWRVVACVSGDVYGIVVGQKNQTVIILEREI